MAAVEKKYTFNKFQKDEILLERGGNRVTQNGGLKYHELILQFALRPAEMITGFVLYKNKTLFEPFSPFLDSKLKSIIAKIF